MKMQCINWTKNQFVTKNTTESEAKSYNCDNCEHYFVMQRFPLIQQQPRNRS